MNFFERCIEKIRITDTCWIWTGAKTGSGYGATRFHGKQVGAHVAAYMERNGAVPGGMCVMHSCDNPLCVNPGHLSVGTTGDNMRDRTRKGRTAKQSMNGRAKLTEALVIEIRQKLAAGAKKRPLSREYGVSDTLIRYIARGSIWHSV